MEVRQIPSIRERVYQVETRVKLTPDEKDLIRKFGNPEVQAGGVFTQGDVTFTLPENIVKIPLDFPHKQTFSGVDLGNAIAEKNSIVFRDEFKLRISASMNLLRSNSDENFRDETISQV